MRIRNKAGGWKFYVALFAFFALSIAAISPTFDRNPITIIKDSVRSSTIKRLELAGVENLSFFNALKSGVNKTLSGTYPVDLDEIEIDIKMKYLTKIRDERELAIKRNILVGQKSYPAKVKYRGETYRANLRLKGDLTDHWSGADRWSFRINLKDGKSILGMSRFSIHKPKSRQIPFDHLFQKLMRSVGNMAPRHEYVRVTFNGDYWGIMNAEEHVTRHMAELNERKEAPFFKIGSEDGWAYEKINKGLKRPPSLLGKNIFSLYNQGRYADDPVQMAYYRYAVSQIRRLNADEDDVGNVLDIDAFSRAMVGAVLWQNLHGVHTLNMRLYLNPYTLLMEPVTADQGEVYSTDGKKSTNKRFKSIGRLPLYSKIILSEQFWDGLEKNFAIVKKAIPDLKQEHDKICAIFPLDCPQFDFARLEQNLKIIEVDIIGYFHSIESDAGQRSKAEKKKNQKFTQLIAPTGIYYPRHIMAEYYNSGRLVIFNVLKSNVSIQSIKLSCLKNTNCTDKIILDGPIDIPPGFDGVFPASTELSIPSGLRLGVDADLEISTRVADSTLIERVEATLPETTYNPLAALSLAANDNRPKQARDFLAMEGTTLKVLPGMWTVEKPILVPAGHRLEIGPGTTLSFAPGAYILSRGAIHIQGSVTAPVRLQAKTGEGWRGIYVVEADEKSEISNTEISNTRAFTSGLLDLTGAVTFYRSGVSLREVHFNGTEAEDALNIVRSDFTITDTLFSDTVSDAFDSDFSDGDVSNMTFTNIGGDGLDTSGSRISGSKLVFENIFDKAVSAGEGSTVTLSGVSASDVGTGLAAKDGSTLEVSKLDVKNAGLFAGMAYIKKPFYGPGVLLIRDTELGLENFFNQLNSELVVNGKAMPGRDLDVDKLYDTGPMKKNGQ